MKHCICTVAPGGPSPPCDLKVLRAWSRLVGAGQQLAGQERPSRWARAPVGECAPGRPHGHPWLGQGWRPWRTMGVWGQALVTTGT